MTKKIQRKTRTVSSRKQRRVDMLTDEIAPWWKKNYVTVGKREVTTWKGALVLMFIAGIAAALIWSAKSGYYNSSNAAAASTLTFNPSSTTTTVGSDFAMDAKLNPGTNSVSAVELHITFDKTKLSLTSITPPSVPSNCTATPAFSTVLQTASIDNVNGTASIVLGVCMATPAAPVVTTSTVATFVFHTLATTSGTTPVTFTAASQAAAIGESGNVITTMTPAQITINSADVTAPSGGSISYTNGFSTVTSATLTVADGTDTGAGLDTSSRIVQRRSATLSAGSCGTYGSWNNITPTGTYPTLTDSTLASGNCYQYQYKISDLAVPANQATYTTTNAIKVDTAAPIGGSVSYTDGFYSSTSVALTANDGTDAVSGINTASRIVQRKSATLANGTCGTYGSFATITPTGSYPGFTDATVASGNCYQYQYLISDAAGKQATFTSTNTAKIDTVAPSGGSVSYTDGYYTNASVTIAVTDGTDGISGLNTASRIVQRKSATLTAGACGAYGSFAAITPTGSYPNFTDSTVTQGNCYQYQYLISDNAGKQATYTTTSTAKIDTAAPVGGSVSITDGFNSTHSIVITASDGTDSVSGIDPSSRIIQRRSASLTGNNCGSFGSWANITPTASYPTFTDTTVVTDQCYQYQYLVSDVAGKQASFASTNSAKITYPADVSLNGVVDIFDYNLLVQNFGITTCGNVADIVPNCSVDIFDYNQLFSDFAKAV